MNNPDHHEYYKYDPRRPPCWRRDRAMELRLKLPRKRPDRRDDRHVRTYWQFLIDYEEVVPLAREEAKLFRRSRYEAPAVGTLFARRPGHWYAHALYHSADAETRSLVEARILARESDEQIAARLGTLPEAIAVYEKLFYDVRDRLACRDWVETVLLKPPAGRNYNSGATPADEQRQRFLKSVGFNGGSLALDVMLSGFPPGPRPSTAAELPSWWQRATTTRLSATALAGLAKLDVDTGNIPQLLKMSIATMSTAAADAKGDSELEQAVKNLMESIPWELGMRLDDKRPHLTGPVEPRAEELWRIEAGLPVPDYEECCRRVEKDLK